MEEEPEPVGGLFGLPSSDAASSKSGIRTPASESRRLILPRALFRRTWQGLRSRSDGERESAAVLVGHVVGRVAYAVDIYFHQELDDDHAGPLSVQLSEAGKIRLYAELSSRNLKIAALIHTHPARWVGLSWIDERNQICSRVGVLSIVVPNYGRTSASIRRCGVHVRTDTGWMRLSPADAVQQVEITTEPGDAA